MRLRRASAPGRVLQATAMPSTNFVLDERLAADTVPLGNLSLSHVLLKNDGRFPWLVLVPRRAGIAEIIDLTPDDRGRLWSEVETVAEMLRALVRPDKLNIAALGNLVPQLHLHVIARYQSDAAWPQPVFGFGTREPLPAHALGVLRDRLVAHLQQHGLEAA